MERAKQLAALLERVRCGEDPEKVRREERELLSQINLKDVACADKYLVDSGITFDRLRQIVYAFASVLGDQVSALRANLPASHIVRKILAEHEMLECFIGDLMDLNATIQEHGCSSSTCTEFRKLYHIAEHLSVADSHKNREEDLIFPMLKGHSCYGLCRTLERAHFRLNSAINNLNSLIERFDSLSSEEFAVRLNSLVMFIVPAMREHLFQEDNILFPIALDVLTESQWNKIRDLSEEMSYCGFN